MSARPRRGAVRLLAILGCAGLLSGPGADCVGAEVDTGARALEVLVEGAEPIRLSALRLAAQALPVIRSEAAKFPVLTALGPARIGMTAAAVEQELGRPDRKEETDFGWRWTYAQPGGRKLVVAFDLENKVTHAMTDSNRHQVPERLGVGAAVQDFERIYGSRRFRESTPVSLQLRLLKYPFSNLALVVDTSDDVVRSVMVFKGK